MMEHNLDGYGEILTEPFHEKLKQVYRLLAEAYEDWQKRSPDHHAKWSEGQVRITTPDHFYSYNHAMRPKVEIYSYVLGPNRNHEFNNIDEALEAVTRWHKQQIEYDYSKDED
jgi:hypothetical protein